jgi:hypothetical protein
MFRCAGYPCECEHAQCEEPVSSTLLGASTQAGVHKSAHFNHFSQSTGVFLEMGSIGGRKPEANPDLRVKGTLSRKMCVK